MSAERHGPRRQLTTELADELDELYAEHVGAQLTACRYAAELTQAELARRLGVSRPRVAQLEQQADANVSTMRDYVAACGGRLVLAVEPPP